MSEAIFPKIAIAGLPNCGKTALFNAITGSRQKVGNYPGVTVERKEGTFTSPSGRVFRVLDLPGTYSLDARTPDEMITRDVLLGRHAAEKAPEALVAVCDATNLERNLGLILELSALKRPMVLALNMMDLAELRGLVLDLAVLERELGVPVVPTVAIKGHGIAELMDQAGRKLSLTAQPSPVAASDWKKPGHDEIRARFTEVDRILKLATRHPSRPENWTERIDRIVLHPVWGLLVLTSLLLLMFQAIFSWANLPMDLIKLGIGALGNGIGGLLADGPLKSLLVNGVIAGLGSVLVFLPQILLLFLFMLALEDSGYMARAAFLMDRIMGRVGLHGRAFIPLLSSFACAVPGIMSTRTIGNPRDRLTTILVAPLTTCSARLPVYSLLIAAFIPNIRVWGPFRAQGLVLMGLYVAGILAPLAVAFVLRNTILRGPKPPLLIELPTYKIPGLRNLAMGLVERARLFLRRAGTVILSLSILLWFLASYPKAPSGATEPAINFSYAGQIGHVIEPVLRPIGFNWKISVALIPGFAAREVMIGALGTVYSVGNNTGGGVSEDKSGLLASSIAKDWSLATALSLLAWYIFAPQCLSTLAITRRETNSWRWPIFMLVYLTVLAYAASFLTFHVATGLGWA